MASPLSILIINGPNLNMLGVREPGIYGTVTLSGIEQACVEEGKQLGIKVTCFQSNSEGEIVTTIQKALNKYDAIVINAGAYTHTSVAIHDALRAVALPVMEVHLSNIYQREEFRHHSYISPIARGVICGLGMDGYIYALRALASGENK
ncbi:MAG: aroQ [Rickettsiales bacterium]|jgi:3-dehydroquinate dehydratase-2|nr:aroQ [Rickettsiales bacterium]